ncbi:hypothetical protein [Pseudarthrobacter phenanthrenivorans]|uniref:hypothetical protein n=1 Tax=Pseudarthrobacter phenanthrenivorans TaxID=361575 RepID=UPI002F35AD30
MKFVPGGADLGGDRAAARGVFDGVGDEVVDGLAEAVRIEGTGGAPVGEQLQSDAAGGRFGLRGLDADGSLRRGLRALAR